MTQQPPTSRQKDILIIDDTPNNVRVLSKMLSEEGYKVRKALTGKQGIVACQIAPPDLILLDIMMPDMNGYEVCEQLKKHPETCKIPIIFISALDDVLDKVKAFRVGGVDYITKPFQVEEVMARIQHQLTIQDLQHQLNAQNNQLQKLNEKLQHSNAELEQFAYIASHDLQSPLAAIHSLSELLQIEAGDRLEPETASYLQDIKDLTANMRRLIRDLLAYARAGNQIKFEEVECDRILLQALANLQVPLQSSQAVLTYDSLPLVRGQRTQLEQLFQNLISNAIKFRRNDVELQIKISVQPQNEQYIFGVHDNGIGIDPKNFDQVFQIFSRLHSSQEYSGTGIGLAVCKKIVEQHGGLIWIESQLGLGSTFYFTLPAILQE